mgnify:CR=1 FL=1
MERREMIKGMVSVYESILDSERGDTFESAMDHLLKYVESKGMLPPQLPKETMKYYALTYGLHWEDSFPIPKK